MKQIITTYLLSVFVVFSTLAHDDIAYGNASGWNIDYGNNGGVDKTLPADHMGSIATFFADYDGDGNIDLCKVDSDGTYLVWNWCLGDSNGHFNISSPTSITFGVAATDKCLVGDFNGDGRNDIAVARSNSSNNYLAWYIDYAPCDRFADVSGQIFGLKGDVPLSGDFNADGVTDVCVYRPSEGKWYVSLSDLTGHPVFQGPYAIGDLKFGIATDTALIGDFNGDGYDDMALYRASDNKIYVNLFDEDKAKLEGYAGLDLYGTIDLTINCAVTNPTSLTVADFDHSRPSTLPLATKEELGAKVNLRHGWTCIFDNSLDVDKWVDAWKAIGVNTLEYHPWMRAHEEIDSRGDSWNTYVGDDRLWTSKAKMKEKITKFKAIGGRNICYTGIYASTPAFAYDYPDWAMRDVNTGEFITYGGKYLNLMSTNEGVDRDYVVNNETFKNFNDYFSDQAEKAQQEYDWDGWRWDWYGFPGMYECDGLTGRGDFSYELAPFTDKLDTSVKGIRSDVTTTTLQLPNASGNIPFVNTAAVVDHQFLELWPEGGGTGDKYSDLYFEIYKAKSKYPDKPLFANFYPPTAMNHSKSWSLVNIRYQFATCLMAGGYPAAQVVDGIAGFTDPVPFHAVNYPTEVLTEISKWNRFAEAYGGYFYYSNEVYLIHDTKPNLVTVENPSSGLVLKAKERIDKRTRQTDGLIINLTDYGQDKNLKWIEENSQPSAKSVNVSFRLPTGLSVDKAYMITPDGKSEVAVSTSGDLNKVQVANLNLFASIIITTNRSKEMPEEPKDYADSFPDYKFEYDANGDSLNKDKTEITVLDDQHPLVIENFYNAQHTTWSMSSDANEGETSVQVNPGKIYFSSNSEDAIRVPVNKFTNFSIAVKGNNSESAWFGFRLLKPSTSSIWEIKDIFYRIGGEQTGLAYIPLTTDAPANDWVVYERDFLQDIINHPYLTVFWKNAIVIGVHFGPVSGERASFDSLKFKTKDHSSIVSDEYAPIVITVDSISKNLQVESSLLKVENIKMYDSQGRFVLTTDASSIDISPLPQGLYVVNAQTKEGYITRKIII